MSILKKYNGMSIDHNNSTITSCLPISWIVLNQTLDSTSCHQTHILCLIGGKISVEIFSSRHLYMYFHFKITVKGLNWMQHFLANQINCHLAFYCFFLLCFVFFKQCLKEIKILINGTNSLWHECQTEYLCYTHSVSKTRVFKSTHFSKANWIIAEAKRFHSNYNFFK